MKSVAWEKRERKVRRRLILDLIRGGWITCKPISERRSTSLLPSTIDARRDVANAETVTMATDELCER